MWIRSQDRKILTEVHDLDIDDANQIWGGCSLLGKYSSEEKALLVLDMIEKVSMYPGNTLFQMLADDEVEVWN